ncbi:MAG TPA: M28 family peptidase [Candidatus Bathyarchaeia archaeon]|nr:M28 family peptidase [Candidatus Bathyarchaeia archaeon]
MSIKTILDQVDIENLYQHLLYIEGVKHPLDNPELLDEVANYLRWEMEEFGLETKEHVFRVDGFDFDFRNIEGLIDNGSESEILVTSHYDTMNVSPGVNDNGSGVAGMLEIARILSNAKIKSNIRFIGFTLEECHPTRERIFRKLMMDSKLIDEELRFTSYHTIKLLDKIDELREEAIIQGKSITESWQFAYDIVKNDATKKELQYIESLKKHYANITRMNWIGKTICVGSTSWVKAHRKSLDKIAGVINLEEIGYSTEKKFSQNYPSGIDPKNYSSYKINLEEMKGNFVGIFADKNSSALTQTFCKQCQDECIDLPYHNLEVAMNFEEISLKIIDLLRSDHAPFWREGIPAITVTDTFEFRYPYYHTEADIMDNLNFNFMKKICQATIATLLNLP